MRRVGALVPALLCAMFVWQIRAAEPRKNPFQSLGVTRESCKETIQRAFEQKVIQVNESELSDQEKKQKLRILTEDWETLTLDDRRIRLDGKERRDTLRGKIEDMVEEVLTSPDPDIRKNSEKKAVASLSSLQSQLVALDLVASWLPSSEDQSKWDILGYWLSLAKPSHPRFLQQVLSHLIRTGEEEANYLKQFIQPDFESEYVFDDVLSMLMESTGREKLAAELLIEFGVTEPANATKVLNRWSESLPKMLRQRLGTIVANAVDLHEMPVTYHSRFVRRLQQIITFELADSETQAEPWLEALAKMPIPESTARFWIAQLRNEDVTMRYVPERLLDAAFYGLREGALLELAVMVGVPQARSAATRILSKLKPPQMSDFQRSLLPKIDRTLESVADFGGEETRAAVDRLRSIYRDALEGDYKALGGDIATAVDVALEDLYLDPPDSRSRSLPGTP